MWSGKSHFYDLWAPFTLEINFEIYVNWFLRKKISSVNSQLSKEINFKILFRNLEHVLFCEILRPKFRLWHSVIGSVYQHRYEASAMFTSGFRKFISSVKSAHFRKKKFEIFLLKWNFEINF